MLVAKVPLFMNLLSYRIMHIDKHFSSRFVVKMDDISQTKLIIGRNYSDQVRRLMEI